MVDAGVRNIRLAPRLIKCGTYGGDVTRSRSQLRLPIYRSRTSWTDSLRLARLWGQRSTSPTPWGGVQRRWRPWWSHWCSSRSLYSHCMDDPSACSCVPHCKHAWRTSCGRCLGRRWRRTCVARTAHCGRRRRPCSSFLRRWVSTVPTWRARTRRVARWIGI